MEFLLRVSYLEIYNEVSLVDSKQVTSIVNTSFVLFSIYICITIDSVH